jgi:hypothetical protein
MLGFFVPGPLELTILLFFPVVIAIIAGGVVLFRAVSSKRTSRPASQDLVRCPDCEHLVSIQANNCPQCGRPIGTDTR